MSHRDVPGRNSTASVQQLQPSMALELREAQLRGILDTASEAIVTADQHQVIVMANLAAAAVFRCPVDRLIGQPLANLIPAQFRSGHHDQVAAFGAAETAGRRMGPAREVLGLRASGEQFPAEAAISHAHVDGQRLYTVILRDLTEQHRASAALRKSEQLTAASFNASSVAMARIDPHTRRFVAVNAALCRLMGYSRAELLAMNPDDLNHPDNRVDEAKFQALLGADTAYREEKRLLRKDGSVLWVEVSGSVVRDEAGQPVSVVGVVQDVNARHEAVAALRMREARQSFLVRLNDRLRELGDPQAIAHEAACLLGEFTGAERVGYAEDDGNGETITVARNHTRGVPGIEGRYRYVDYGLALVAALRGGRTVVRPDIAHDPTLSDDEKAAHAVLQLGATVNVPLLRDGQLRAVFFVHATLPRDWTAGEVALFEEVAQRVRADIERARAEAALRAAKAKLETALESMTDAVFIADTQGRLVEFNAAFASFHRFAGKAECPRTLAEYPAILEGFLSDGSPLPLAQWAVPRALRGESGGNLECWLQRKDSGERWAGSFSYAPLRDEAGGIVGAVVTARDVTAAKQVQAALARSHADMQRLFAARDLAQEQERLRIAREIHDETLQGLAAIMLQARAAHALGGGARGAVDSTLDRIEALAAHAITSTRRLIADMRPAILDELGLLPALGELAARFTERSGVACGVNGDALAPADEQQVDAAQCLCLYRVAQEALNNVARHAGAHAARIALASGAPGWLRLSVVDDGAGLAAGDEAKAQSFGLLGMRERVRVAGGTLQVTSAAGTGTTIEVELPLTLAGAGALPSVA